MALEYESNMREYASEFTLTWARPRDAFEKSADNEPDCDAQQTFHRKQRAFESAAQPRQICSRIDRVYRRMQRFCFDII
ncbi:hypothetical protein PTKU15_84330 [Paraburkholderia terrae]|nr:hypothetical protein PTKU15_84330 [Paraburkholderia terrae]